MSEYQTHSKIPPEKEKLEAMHELVHQALRKLKMGEKGYITCDKHSADAVRSYLWAYAFHKNKWFDTEYDATSKIMTAVRSPPPPWDEPETDDDPDEE